MLKNFLNGSPLLLIGMLVFLGWKLLGDNKTWTSDSGKAPPIADTWTVTKVSDGDTITVRQTTGEELKIRLCGIDANEKQQKLGTEATNYLRSLVEKAENEVLVIPIEKDRYGRTVAEIMSRGKDGVEVSFQEEMLKSGMAMVYPAFINRCPNADAFKRAEEIAKSQRLGVWADASSIPPWKFRRQRHSQVSI